MKITKAWAMPSHLTFSIKPISEFISRNTIPGFSVDPFANQNRLADICNDIDPQYDCDCSMDALDFLKQFPDQSIDMVYFDPPYSPRQVSESYKN